MAEKRMFYFLCYHDSIDMIDCLTDEQAGRLWKMLFNYAINNVTPNIEDPMIHMGFNVIAAQIDRDRQKYIDKCEQSKKNINKRWHKENTDLYNGVQSNTTVNNGIQPNTKDTNKNKNKNKSTNINTNTKIESVSNSVDSRSHIDYLSVINSFNSICISLPKVQKLTDTRKKKIKNAIKLLEDISFDDFFQIIENSDFLTGRDGKWNGCSFDWILQPANITKIFEGNYNNREIKTEKPEHKQQTVFRSQTI